MITLFAAITTVASAMIQFAHPVEDEHQSVNDENTRITFRKAVGGHDLGEEMTVSERMAFKLKTDHYAIPTEHALVMRLPGRGVTVDDMRTF